MQFLIKLQAKALNVEDLMVIEATIRSLHVDSCKDYLDRCKTHLFKELSNLMEEYTKSDKGQRRRIEAMKGEKKAKKDQWS